MTRMVDCVAIRRQVADSLTHELREVDGVSAVVLFGSTSRGDAHEHSDIDLLILMRADAEAGPIRRMCRDAWPMRISPVLHSQDSFEQLKRDDWLFVKHLRDEGTRLWDAANEFNRHSHVSRPCDKTVIREIQTQGRALERLSEPQRYGNDFLFPLVNVYTLAKRIAMLANARAGVSIFQREQAFLACADLYPRVASELAHITALEPFYAQTQGNRTAQPPFSSDGAVGALLDSVESLKRIIEATSLA